MPSILAVVRHRRFTRVMRTGPVLAGLLLTSLAGGCKKKGWDWREHLELDCMVSEDNASVSVHAEDGFPAGAVVEVPELPELGYTVNNSGVYMRSASILPLAPGSQTLTFNITSGDESASTHCTIERPVFPAKVDPLQLQSEAFARARIRYTLTPVGGEPQPVRAKVALNREGQFILGFRVWKPKAVEAGGATLSTDEAGDFELPVAAAVGAKAEFTATNLDDQSRSYVVELTEIQPWVEDDVPALASGIGSAFEWAASTQAPAPAADADPPAPAISAVLVEGEKILHHTGPMRVLTDVERIAQVEIKAYVFETCKYGTSEGTTAEIDRISEEAKVVVYDAKTGSELARKTLRSKPPKCPKSAEFLVTKTNPDDEGAAFDQRLDAEITPDVIAWFEKASQR